MALRKILKEAAHRPAFAARCLIESSANAAKPRQKFLVVKQPLIGTRALYYDFGLPINGEHRRLAGSLQFAKMTFGVALEVAERVNIGQLNHAVSLHEISCRSRLVSQPWYVSVRRGRADSDLGRPEETGQLFAGSQKYLLLGAAINGRASSELKLLRLLVMGRHQLFRA